jgi:hypothetical protein
VFRAASDAAIKVVVSHVPRVAGLDSAVAAPTCDVAGLDEGPVLARAAPGGLRRSRAAWWCHDYASAPAGMIHTAPTDGLSARGLGTARCRFLDRGASRPPAVGPSPQHIFPTLAVILAGFGRGIA